jgi:hypothetical protein
LTIFVCCQNISANIYIASGGGNNQPNRFIWLPSTKNRKVFKVSNEDQIFGPDSGTGNIDPINGLVNDDAMDMEKDQEALRNFFNANNNGRHINFRRRN